MKESPLVELRTAAPRPRFWTVYCERLKRYGTLDTGHRHEMVYYPLGKSLIEARRLTAELLAMPKGGDPFKITCEFQDRVEQAQER